MLCICCLKKDSHIKISLHCHGNFLNQFFINDPPPFDQVVCWECHMTLKNINEFKKQVEESVKELMKQYQNKEINKEKEAVSLEEYHKPDNTQAKLNDTRLKNIDTALNIINSNTASLQSISLFESIIKATKQSFNLQNIVLPDININNDNSKRTTQDDVTTYQSAVLSDTNRKLSLEHNGLSVVNNIDDSKEVEITNVNGSAVLSYVKSNPDCEMLPDINNYNSTILEKNDQEVWPNVCSQSVLLFPDTNQTQTHIKPDLSDKTDAQNEVLITKSCTESDLINESDIKAMLPVNSTKLPEGNKNITEVANDSDFTVLPVIKNNSTADFEDSSNSYNLESPSCTEFISENNSDQSDDISLNKDDTMATSEPLIKIKLNKKQLFRERKLKRSLTEFKNSKHKCYHCIISFKYKINLIDHFKRRHTKKPDSAVCKICKQVILTSDRKQHKYRHYNRFECRVCKQRFVLYDEGSMHYKKNHSQNENNS